jgi:predicted dehydrogenase
MTWSRRSLLAGAAGVPLLPQARKEPALRLPRRLKIGIIGFDGHVSEILDPLPSLPDVELAAVADAGSDPAAKRSYSKHPLITKARPYATAAEMLKRETLDLVAVCNNDGERTAAILACANRHLNVIAEKPLALNRRDLDAVYAAVEANHIHLGMLLPMRFDPPYRAMQRIVEAGEIGEVFQIDAQKSYQLGVRPAWQKHASTYGSTILWIGIHMIDLMTWCSGRTFMEVASYQARAGLPEAGDMETVTASIFRLDNGGTATLRMDYLRPATAAGHGDDRLRLAGTRGIVEYQEATGVTVMTDRMGPRTLTALPPQGSVFVDFLRPRPTLTWPEIVRANEITLATHESAQAHRIIAIPNPPSPVARGSSRIRALPGNPAGIGR